MKTFEAFVLNYLLNALWQVPLLFGAAILAARALRRTGPAVEHRVWVSALIAQAFLPACPAPASLWPVLLRLLHRRSATDASAHGSVTVALGPATALHGLHLSPAVAGFVLGLYVASVTFGCGRLLIRLRATASLRRRAQPLTLGTEETELWKRACQRTGVLEPELGASPQIFGPVTMGVRRTLVLLPCGMANGTASADLATVFTHECMHIRRGDYLRNVLYQALSLPILFHPVTWLTLSRITESREMLCDHLAAEALTGPELYARSLLRVASLLVEGVPGPAVHAIGIFDANAFERRVSMLTQPATPLRGLGRIAMLAAVAIFGLATCASALALRTGVIGQESAQQDAPPAGAVRIAGGVVAGQLLAHTNPIYPQAAKDAKVQGSVILHAVIGKDGTIQSLQVVSGPEELRASAWEAVKTWVYKPFMLNGEPTAVETTITVNYLLAPDEPASKPLQ
jgi:TonB family protein